MKKVSWPDTENIELHRPLDLCMEMPQWSISFKGELIASEACNIRPVIKDGSQLHHKNQSQASKFTGNNLKEQLKKSEQTLQPMPPQYKNE